MLLFASAFKPACAVSLVRVNGAELKSKAVPFIPK